MPWRDATGLLRAPTRLAWAAAWCAVSAALVLLVPVIGGMTGEGEPPGVGRLTWLLAAGGGTLWWARHTARRLHRASR